MSVAGEGDLVRSNCEMASIRGEYKKTCLEQGSFKKSVEFFEKEAIFSTTRDGVAAAESPLSTQKEINRSRIQKHAI
ncbi:hypothetical protein AYI70_g7654 [Smittium culicis]|uniref:Uncharacterized protein n=1 Tax=Smittium culicis TaxID=133412 RepID=A0A1R1XJL4_9FUNG|nr:hypothetical protein AYI70_g7654 [Smittium culicis]